ncbi:MAG: fructose-6-phosphate aldolase [Bacteroidia bacterium]|nr:fructose-6-phosphate aldolase [Bacteroidia bacterium]MDW8133998.1 fructose-6-phosphate aldolase [Bacteroidia bacterium]
MRYYLLKVKGTAKIPDYVQIRDERFSLVCYLRSDRIEKKAQLPAGFLERVSKIFPQLPYGQVRVVEWNPDTKEVTLV